MQKGVDAPIFLLFFGGFNRSWGACKHSKNMKKKVRLKYLGAKIEKTWCPRGEIRDWGWRAAASELLSTVARPRETHASMLSQEHLFQFSGNVHFLLN